MDNCKLLIDLCVNKLDEDNIVLIDLLSTVLCPTSKFQLYNSSKASDVERPADKIAYARPPENRIPSRGWLIELLNRFGDRGGFTILRDRFIVAPGNGRPLTFPLISSLIRPFGQCYDLLTPTTIKTYFMPLIDIVTEFLRELSDEDMKKNSKNEVKNDALSAIMKSLKCLVSQVPSQEEKIRELEIFRLEMILRLLKISSYNGKMNALNEVNKVIMNVSYYYNRPSQSSLDEEEWLTADRMASWISENNVLSIVLRDSLHQPQYVEKLEKIVRFMIKEKTLTPDDLDTIWQAQHGKHDAIVKNIHELLAKLAWDFSPEQLDHLFKCFQDSWHNANKKQREKLLELIRRLAEDDKEGVMAQKVLGLLWTLARAEECPTDTMDQALSALIKILDYSCSQDRDKLKLEWTYKFVNELKNNKLWVLPSLKQIMEICKLFNEGPATFSHQGQSANRVSQTLFKNNVISDLQNNHKIVMTVSQNLVQYMENAAVYHRDHPEVPAEDYLPDNRYNHLQQVADRLKFLRFVLKDGHLWLCSPQAVQIWECLAINAVYPSDREACFKWFTKLMGEDPDLDPDIAKEFFENQILRLDPSLLTENGMSCFERFFRNVNTKESNRLIEKKHCLVMNDLNLVGMDYLWTVILHSSDTVANKAIGLMKELHANLGPNLQTQQETIHHAFISDCFERLQTSYETLKCLTKDGPEEREREASRMIRVLTVLHEYISECDDSYADERALLSLSRASRGKHISIFIRTPTGQGSRHEDLEIWSHTHDTLGCVKRQFLTKNKMLSSYRVELYLNGDLLDVHGDKKLISQIPIRDKTILTAKICASNSNAGSASESSSESSPSASPLIGHNDGPNSDAERCLPGVILSQDIKYIPFLHSVCDYCISVSPTLTDLLQSTRGLLDLSPAHQPTIQNIKEVCQLRAQHMTSNVHYGGVKLESRLFSSVSGDALSPSTAVYMLEVIYSLLMPAEPIIKEETVAFIVTFIESGGVSLVLKALTQNDFMTGADTQYKRDALHLILKIAKVMLLTAAYAKVQCVADKLHQRQHVNPVDHQYALDLQDILTRLPVSMIDPMLKHLCATQLGKRLMSKALQYLPDGGTIKAVLKIVWSACSCSVDLLSSSTEEMQQAVQKMSGDLEEEEDLTDIQVACVGLQILTLCLMLHPDTLQDLHKEKIWQEFIIDTILICKNRYIRSTAEEQFHLIASRTKQNFFISLLFLNEMKQVPQYANQSTQYFSLLCHLLNWAQLEQPLNNCETRLKAEIDWLKNAAETTISSGVHSVNESLLEGHLGLARELVFPLSSDRKKWYGSASEGSHLIKDLMEVFLLPASKVLLAKKLGMLTDIAQSHVTAICQTTNTINAAYDLLVALCTGCVDNLELISYIITEMFHHGDDAALTEWEYLPPVGMRPAHGFVGLKNGGATCYMNSVIQQLYMVQEIRDGMLSIEGLSDEVEEGEVKEPLPPKYDQLYPESDSKMIEGHRQAVEADDPSSSGKPELSEKAYNHSVLKQVQIIFAHLARSKLQFYIPKGFWKQFRIQGEQVNLREQHDAFEFFGRLVDSCDEAMKTLDKEQLCSQVLGGSYADQKICKDCPHRYSQDQPFTALNLEIRNHQHLKESLEQYVKGDLLEGANAYYCEKCKKKVDTVKRMCVKRLPKMLAIQLKRFDYDWERECPIKFNDYFEFPREIDMEPYTVYGLAKMEGENWVDEDEKSYADQATQYRLTGVVVHSGQASGGHYYSYIKHSHSQYPDGAKWYKFDDGDVSECKMDDDEELKKECFGGEYTGEVFDHMLKRMSFRRQKRWWNAYILMYERVQPTEKAMDESEETKETSSSVEDITKAVEELTLGSKSTEPKIPVAIERIVRRQNLNFMHNKNQFCAEHFQFMRKLINCNVQPVIDFMQQYQSYNELPENLIELSFISVRLASQFLFSVGFHTKKTLRGSAADWYEILTSHLRTNKKIRSWFAEKVLFDHPERFSEYLLESSSSEVRVNFAKIIAVLAHLSRTDGPCPVPRNLNLYADTGVSEQGRTLSDHLIMAVLALLRKEVSENGRHVTQYFHLFLMYCNLGPEERRQLLSLNVLGTFIQVAIDEGPGPSIKYQYVELAKLFSVVSILIRCCDVSSECRTQDKRSIAVNPYTWQNQPPYPLPQHVANLLFKNKAFVKKIVEENINQDDTKHLLLYLSFENARFSAELLNELLWQIAYIYTNEMRPYLDLLQALLMMEDSWQASRILNTLVGLDGDKEALFDIIHKSKNNYQKRSYQCIKMLVNLLSKCEAATSILHEDRVLYDRWVLSVRWLRDELERRSGLGGNNQYAYSNWSPPAQSNEASNGYFLERSQSAKMCLVKALELIPEEDTSEADGLLDAADDQDYSFIDSHNQPTSLMPNTGASNDAPTNDSPADHNVINSANEGTEKGM
ncbi:ubiquitin carboxyl-terminal hydrolase 9X-like [Watersipora subatra]|uniref:ubiquitin carboxyl-terminal hydrolase 9X-like n=1 Tax=Watersipora subatra TaxID=2589382 RepID=UPI00355BEDE6